MIGAKNRDCARVCNVKEAHSSRHYPSPGTRASACFAVADASNGVEVTRAPRYAGPGGGRVCVRGWVGQRGGCPWCHDAAETRAAIGARHAYVPPRRTPTPRPLHAHVCIAFVGRQCVAQRCAARCMRPCGVPGCWRLTSLATATTTLPFPRRPPPSLCSPMATPQVPARRLLLTALNRRGCRTVAARAWWRGWGRTRRRSWCPTVGHTRLR